MLVDVCRFDKVLAVGIHPIPCQSASEFVASQYIAAKPGASALRKAFLVLGGVALDSRDGFRGRFGDLEVGAEGDLLGCVEVRSDQLDAGAASEGLVLQRVPKRLVHVAESCRFPGTGRFALIRKALPDAVPMSAQSVERQAHLWPVELPVIDDLPIATEPKE